MTQIDEPNLDEQIDEIFTQFLKNDPWTLAEDELEEFVAETKANFKALIATQVQEARIDERNNCRKDFPKSYVVGDKSGDYIILGIVNKKHGKNRKFRVECNWCGAVMFRYSNKFKAKHIMCNCWRDEVKRQTRLTDRIAQLRSTPNEDMDN